MTDLSNRLAELSPAQRAVLMRRREARRLTVPRGPVDGPAPLTSAQKRLWFVHALDPGNTAYNLGVVFRLAGPLDPDAMQAAFDALAARHAALRTRFDVDADGAPRQVPGPRPILRLIDVSGEPEASMRAQVAEMIAAPHDLARGAVRAGLIRTAPEDHVLAIGLHHIVADRWATGILVRELAALYAAKRRGLPDPLPPAPLGIADYACWQAGPDGRDTAEEISWWRDRLADAPMLDLPRDRRPGATPAGDVLPFALPEDLAATARGAARGMGVSLFTLLVSAFALLLSRYGDTDDVVLGTDVTNRDRPETETLVGPLVNTVALRTRFDDCASFADAVSRVQSDLRATIDHGSVPLEQVVEALNPDRGAGETVPLFRAKFDLQHADPLPERFDDLRLSRLPHTERATKYELRFNLEEDGTGIGGRIEYRADLYDRDTIGRMAGHYRRLLAALLANPAGPIADCAMLGEDERAELMAFATGPDLPGHAVTLHGAVEARADLMPDAPALTHGDQTLSYAALDAKANAVAAALIARGLPPEACIGIFMGRTPDLVAAILGVLKAGCAYVPLDPAYPAARSAFTAKDAGIAFVLTDGRDPDLPGVEAIDASDLPAAPRPAARAAGDTLAVVIYTSGSTGTPKGVALEHRNILSRVAWADATFEADELSGVLFATSVSFDLSLFEIFATLALGGRMVLAETLLDLSRLPATAGVTFLNTVPSLLRELLRAGGLPTSVRAINLAGEFFPALLDDLQGLAHLRRINNLYGPTEDAIYDAGNPVEQEAERPMPIGRPFPGSRIHILDRTGALLPRGAVGEICVAGAGLARGYLNRPDLTTERFGPDPFASEPSARLYRTGDRGRWRADGRIDILGRIDGQVKIRGQRIETGEIEARLEARDEVGEAVILVSGAPGTADRQLVAHVATASGRTVQADLLRDHLRDRLPRHMVPTLWRIHPEFPRLPNGKTDRRALADLNPADAMPTAVAPATETERRVIALWSALLGQDEIGAESDFFGRGGHSLLAMRLVIRLNETFGADLSLGEVYHAVTPRHQAALIDARIAAPSSEAGSDPTAGLSDAEVDALLSKMTATETQS